MTHTLQAIAWTLIHFCWQAAVVAASYRLLSAAIAHRTSHARYVVSLAALLLMLAAALGTFAWELNAGSSAPASSVAAAVNSAPHTTLEVLTAPVYARTTAETAAPSFPIATALPWIDGMWILGVIALSLRSLGGWWLIQRLRRASNIEAPAAVRASFARIATVLGLHRSVMLRVSNAIAGPLTVGALRAMVLLPLSAITSLGPDELEVVLAHELAHVRRADFFWNLVQTLAETLFFFHPAVWWINARIRSERELCCDDLALQVCPNPVAYAEALLRLEEQRSQHWRLAMALDGHQSPQTLRRRIARILGEPVAQLGISPVRPFSLAAVCAGLFVLLLTVPQLLASLSPVRPSVHAPAIYMDPSPTRSLAIDNRAFHPATTGLAIRKASPLLQAAAAAPQEKPADSSEPKTTYIDRMKEAGYDVDLDKLIAMKIQGVTPEYAKAMAQVGFGKPSADDLIACKIQGVSPEAIAQFKQQGLQVESLHDAISFRIFQVTPEFVSGMKAAGFDHLTSKQLVNLRVQDVTPEYAREITQQFPGATVDDLIKTRIFRIDGDFIAMVKKHGFTDLSLDKLVKLRISGIFDDESAK
jgi:beta-lactamase regulating signal transducer with metallopeptidase domain